jgi:hypothetical protein
MNKVDADAYVRSIFSFPRLTHNRKHGPDGYEDYKSFKEWLRDEFVFRCAYCLAREQWEKDGKAVFSIDHFTPQSVDSSISLKYDNLFYVCLRCNYYKNDLPGHLNPCSHAMADHIYLKQDGEFGWHTKEGRGHILLLDLNDPDIVGYRLRVISAVLDAWSSQDAERINQWLGYPRDLPNLMSLRPPKNTKPNGKKYCFYKLKENYHLPLLIEVIANP